MRTTVLLYGLLLLVTSAHLSAQDSLQNRAAALIDQGRIHFFSHQYPEAAALYRQALDISPGNASALYELAWTLFEQAEYPRSIEAASEATLYSSDLQDQLYALIGANYYYDMTVAVYELELTRRTEEDVRTYKRMAMEAEDGAERLFKLGLAYKVGNEPGKAVTAFLESAYKDPYSSRTHLELAKILDFIGESRLSALAYARAAFLDPTGPFTSRYLTLLENALLQPLNPTQSFTPLISPGNNPESIAEYLDSARTQSAAAFPEVADYYQPWFTEMAGRGLLEAFGYYVYQTGNARIHSGWKQEHGDQLRSLIEWDSAYVWPESPFEYENPENSKE